MLTFFKAWSACLYIRQGSGSGYRVHSTSCQCIPLRLWVRTGVSEFGDCEGRSVEWVVSDSILCLGEFRNTAEWNCGESRHGRMKRQFYLKVAALCNCIAQLNRDPAQSHIISYRHNMLPFRFVATRILQKVTVRLGRHFKKQNQDNCQLMPHLTHGSSGRQSPECVTKLL